MYFFKEFCCKEEQINGVVAEGRTEIKEGFLFCFVFKVGEIVSGC